MKLSRVLFSKFTIKQIKKTIQLKERETTIQAPWGKLRGLSWGDESAPPVFLCTGKVDVCSGYRPLVKLLPPCFHYVTVDLPGSGKSDHFPAGVHLTAMDYVPTVDVVRKHYKWDKFMFVGHSLGAILGKFFNFVFPGHITRMVELDPHPAYDCYEPKPAEIRDWYNHTYHNYYEEARYRKLNGGSEPPKYTYEKALDMIMKNRGLHKEAAELILERAVVPAGDGLYRFTHDQRLKRVARLPLSSEALRSLYTYPTTPTFCVLAKSAVDSVAYDKCPFIWEPESWPHWNYSVKIVEGTHDVHIDHPERLADDVSAFLLADSKAKLLNKFIQLIHKETTS